MSTPVGQVSFRNSLSVSPKKETYAGATVPSADRLQVNLAVWPNNTDCFSVLYLNLTLLFSP